MTKQHPELAKCFAAYVAAVRDLDGYCDTHTTPSDRFRNAALHRRLAGDCQDAGYALDDAIKAAGYPERVS